jgi:hypothetical protein
MLLQGRSAAFGFSSLKESPVPTAGASDLIDRQAPFWFGASVTTSGVDFHGRCTHSYWTAGWPMAPQALGFFLKRLVIAARA